MNYIFSIFIFLLFISCSNSKKEKKTYKNGGITISFTAENAPNDFEQKLKSRLDFIRKSMPFDYDINKVGKNYVVRLPFILSENQISFLLFSKGEIFIKKDDAIFFDSSSFESNRLDYNSNGYDEMRLSLKKIYWDSMENFTAHNLNQNIEVYIDSTLIMSPVVLSPITDGKIMIKTPKSDSFNNTVIIAILDNPYEAGSFKNIQKTLYLRDKDELAKIPKEYFDIYNQLQRFVLTNGKDIVAGNTNYYSEDELETSNEILKISRSDFYGYLTDSNITSMDELKDSFFKWQTYL